MRLLATERLRAIEAIRSAVDEESSVGWVTEVMIERPHASATRAFRVMRIDMACGDRIREINVDAYTDFETFELRTSGGLHVVVDPIVWNGVVLSVAGIRADDPALVEWALAWLDLDELSEGKPDGFFGVIHSMLEPRVVQDRVELDIDFGSAPVEAVLDLLTVLRERGATEVRLSSEWATH